MSIFDDITLQGGLYSDASLDFDFENASSSSSSLPLSASVSREHQINTISPTDVWTDEAIMSAPPSTAFPQLGTPSSDYLESPGYGSTLNTTPMLESLLDSELDYTKLDSMPSLFPDAGYDQFGQSTRIADAASFGSLNDVSAQLPAQASPPVRQKSSPGRPPIAHTRKPSLSVGVNKPSASKARRSLPEITIEDEDDKETAKRKKNTAAARKSRQRKQDLVQAQATEIDRLRALVKALGGDPGLEYAV